ncbi:DUF3800 domain-containing protein [Candidatus Binatus sp.]|uniref:DUF3800 domain-containing protein n=1 Tax=Candidatus Binatus sp. TaxID=2811406 RepID=UPI002F957CBB
MFQVYVDDSGRGEDQNNPLFVLAGYVGRARNWLGAVDDLQRIMRKEPRLDYLKGKEAASLKDHFNGWSEAERDAKLAEMIGVLNKYKMIALSIGIRYADFNRILARPKGAMKNPYALAFCHVVVWMLDSARKNPVRETIELIFDQGVIGRERNIRAAYEGMMGHLLKEMTDLLIGRPQFEDDWKFLPLQMADLFAWHSRRDYIEQLASRGTRRLESNVWNSLRTSQGKGLFLNANDLAEFKRRSDARFGFYRPSRG